MSGAPHCASAAGNPAARFPAVLPGLVFCTILLSALAAYGIRATPSSAAQQVTQTASPLPKATETLSLRTPTARPTPTWGRLESDEDVIGVLAPRDLRPRDNDIRFDQISIEEGLSQSSVRCILQDHKGFMWFGTEDGLNKHDGYGFTIFRHDPATPTSLSHNQIRCLLEDGQGMLWIGTAGGGLNRLDPESGEFTHYRHDHTEQGSLIHDNVQAILQDSKGVLWIATAGGLEEFDQQGERFIHHEWNPHSGTSLSDNAITSIYEGRDGRVWVGTMRGGLNAMSRATTEFSHYLHHEADPRSLSSDYVTALLEDSQGRLWVGTQDGGLSRLDRGAELFVRYRHYPTVPTSLAHDSVTDLFEDRSGSVWIATGGGGLDRYEQDIDGFIHYRNDPVSSYSLSHNDVLSIYEDRGGVLWIGTLGGGLNKANRANQKFAHYRGDPNDPSSLSGNRVLAIWENRNGVLWVGTQEGGLSRLDRSTGEWTRFLHEPENADSLGHSSVWSIHEDRSGALWIGTGRGLDRYVRGSGRFVHYDHNPSDPNSPSPGAVHAILEDASGTLWIGTMGGGLCRLDPNSGDWTRYEHDPGDPFSLSHNSVQSLHQTYEGSLWIGTRGGGLNRFDPQTERFTEYRHDPNDPYTIGSDMVYCLAEDFRGRLYVGTWGAGFDRLDIRGKRFIHFREADGLPNDVVCGIAEDRSGFLWLSTNKGLSRFDPARGAFRNYDISDGLQSNEFSPGAYHVAESGELFFGGIDGLNVFFPPNVEDNPHVPPVVITAFREFDDTVLTDISEDLALELSYNVNFIAFEFAALDYTAPQKNQYTYRLEGFDPRWVDAGTRRYQSYSNLQGGDYVFRVIGSNNDGVWNREGIAIYIRVVPPLWDRLWFRVVLALVLAGSTVAGYRLRVRNIQTRTRELQAQVDERTYEIERRRVVAEGLREILVILNANRPLGETLDHIASQAALLTGASMAIVFRREAGQSAPTVLGSYNSSHWTRRSAVPALVTEWLVARMMNGEPLLVPSLDECRSETPQLAQIAEHCALLAVPLNVAGGLYGGLALFFAQERAFSAEDVELGLTLVDQAALAIANAQLRERVEHIAAEAERSRLARDLHDAVTQTLFSASLIAEVLPTAWEADQQEGHQLLRELRQLSRGAMAEMRTLLLELRPAALVETRLGELLRQLAEAVTGRTGLPVEVTLSGQCTLPDDAHVALYRIAQETLNNVMKHANAENVRISLQCRSWPANSGGTVHQQVKLQISDDGRGFDPQSIPPERLGLQIIRERAQAIGASLEVASEPGSGTTVTAVWKG